jgi:hypothetical protein
VRITPASAIIILGLLALLGILAYLRVEGAAVAAIGAAGTLVAWLVKPPTKDKAKPDEDPSEAPTIPPPPDKPTF